MLLCVIVILMSFQGVLDVAPADGDVPGMEFMTRSTVFGHQVSHYSPSAPVIS
jgi:hypothetical protein